jgi:hypothetical protein
MLENLFNERILVLLDVNEWLLNFFLSSLLD